MGEEIALANDHADYVAGLVRTVYVDAFIHGFKHGEVDSLDEGEKRAVILKILKERQEKAHRNKEHISNYATFAIREEIIDAFKDTTQKEE
jgi:hypothetical protein